MRSRCWVSGFWRRRSRRLRHGIDPPGEEKEGARWSHAMRPESASQHRQSFYRCISNRSTDNGAIPPTRPYPNPQPGSRGFQTKQQLVPSFADLVDLAGAAGFEPAITGPKPVALPLGYAPFPSGATGPTRRQQPRQRRMRRRIAVFCAVRLAHGRSRRRHSGKPPAL